MRAIAYVRVSTEDQAEHGVSLAAQEQKIRQYADLYAIAVVEVVRDAGISAKRLDTRPGVQRVLDMVRGKRVDAVIVAKLDRLTRSVRDLADIIELVNAKGVALVSVAEQLDSSSASGRMVINMLGVIAAWERETAAERTGVAIRYRRSQREAYSRWAPYGYERQDDSLVPAADEQSTIAVIMQLAGTHTPAAICRVLEQRGIRTRNGSAHWHRKVVGKIIADADVRVEMDKAARAAA